MANISQAQVEEAVQASLESVPGYHGISKVTYNEESNSYTARVFCTDNTTYYDIIVPSDTNNVSAVVGYIGPNGDEFGINCLTGVTEANTNLQTITVMTNGNYDGFRALETATNISKALGCNVDKAMQITYSAGDYNAVNILNEYAGNHPEMKITYLNNEGINYQRWFEESTENMVKNGNVTVVYTGIKGNSDDDITMRKIEKLGIPCYQIEPQYDEVNGYHYQTHMYLNQVTYTDGYIDYLLGLKDAHGAACTYKFNKIVNGEYIEITDDEMLAGLITSTLPLKLLPEDRIAIERGETGTLASNLCAVAASMQNINDNISNYSPVSLQNTTSTASVPANLNNCVNGFMGISSGVLGNLSKETELITNIAQCIYDMDKDLSNRAYSLSDGTELLGGVNSLDSLLTYYKNNPPTFDLKISNFMFNPTGHSEGTTGSVNKSELTELLKETSPLRQNLTNEKDNAKSINASIDIFKNAISSGMLKGEIYDSVAANMDVYKGLMDKRITYAQKLDDAIVSALNLIVDYMGDYDSLDDGELETQRTLEKSIMASIADAKNKISATKLVTVNHYDDKGFLVDSYDIRVYVYDAATRAEAAKNLIEWEEDLAETRALITALEGLWEKVAEAEQIINDALSEIYANYGKEASNVVTGKTSTYEPPANTNFEPIKIIPKTYESTERKTPWYKVTEASFNKNKRLQDRYGTYDDYLNDVLKANNDAYNPDILKDINPINDTENDNETLEKTGASSTLGSTATPGTTDKKDTAESPETSGTTDNNDTAKPTGTDKVSAGEFNKSTAMKDEYGNYENYLKGIRPEKTDTQGAPSQSAPSQSAPSQSAPSQSAPSQSAPSQSAPSQSAPSQSTPSQSAPSQSTPSQSTPSQSTPAPTESEPTPAESTPTPAESTPTPAETTPAESTPAPVETKPTPVEQKPVTTERKPVVNYGNKTSVNNNKPIANNNSPKVETPVTEQPIVETPIVEEPVIETPVIEEPIVETPIIEEPVIETPIIEEPVIETPVIDTPIVEQPKVSGQSNNMLKNAAIIAGAGAVIGGAAYGAHKYLKSKEDSDSDGYSYESDEDEDSDQTNY